MSSVRMVGAVLVVATIGCNSNTPSVRIPTIVVFVSADVTDTATAIETAFDTDLGYHVELSQVHAGIVISEFLECSKMTFLRELHEWGARISSGQLHRLITNGKEKFHQEKDEILRVGLRVSQHIHVDDTGARHQGKNGYCTHIGNEWFAWFESTASKSRINFLDLLRAGQTDYVLSGEALEYMAAQKLPKEQLTKLAAATHQRFADKRHWQAALQSWDIVKKRHIRIATEGALLGSALAHGINPRLAIMSDDAGQFNVLLHALCWIHAERLLGKLVGFNDAQRRALAQVRTTVWRLYRDLKSYKASPTPAARGTLENRFDTLCATKTCFVSLNLALKRMGRNKRELLLVLERPDLPLHNNLSEGDIREYVKRRKISGGTRSEDGRRCRDTFASLRAPLQIRPGWGRPTARRQRGQLEHARKAVFLANRAR